MIPHQHLCHPHHYQHHHHTNPADFDHQNHYGADDQVVAGAHDIKIPWPGSEDSVQKRKVVEMWQVKKKRALFLVTLIVKLFFCQFEYFTR